MNCKEALRAVVEHREVRPVPFSIKFTVEARERYAAHLGRSFDEVSDTGSYVVASHTNKGWKEVKPGYFMDYFGAVWNKTTDRTLGLVDEPILKNYTFGDYRFPDADKIPVYGFIKADKKKYPDRYHMVSIGFSLFERAWSLIGMEELFMGFIEEPEFIHELLDRITAYNDKVIRNAAQLGIDAVHFGDDWGSQNGPIVSRDMWCEFVKPRFKQSCAVAKAYGLQVSLHCCGNVEPLMDDILDSGVDVFDPFQPEAMDVWKLREKYRGRMAFWGGLSVQRIMPFGTVEDVKNETRRLLSEMAPGGGYILSPAHSISGDVPPENIDAFLEVAQNQ